MAERKGESGAALTMILGTSLTALFFALLDILLLPSPVVGGLGFFRVWVQLAPSLAGHLVPYAAVVVGVLEGTRLLPGRLPRRTRSASLVSLLVCLALGPYLWSVADYAFSGPRISASPQRGLFVIAAFGSLELGAFAFTRLASAMSGRGRLWPGLVAWGLASGLLLLNRLLLPNEYEDLHRFVSWVALVLVAIGSLELAKRARFVSRSKGWKVAMVPALVLAAALGTWTLATSEVLAWPVWSETPGSRYLTHRWGADEEEGGGVELPSDVKLEKPAVGDPRIEADARKARRAARAPHLVVFSIDNLQADRVGAYGYDGNPTTPNIDRIAADGAVFRRAYTLFPGTRVFMSSMLTGRRIFNIGRHDLSEPFKSASLPRMLKARDYHVLVKGVFELTAYQDFNPQDYAIDTNLRRATPKEIKESGTIPHIPLEQRFEKIDRHLAEARKAELPAFVWIHLLGPHRFRGGFVGSRKHEFGGSLSDRYDATIRETEEWLAHLEALVEKHLNDDGREVYWFIQSDHGAGMTRSSGRETGKTLYEDQVHVPLIIKGPGVIPGSYDMLVDSAVDVSATLLDLAGISPPLVYDGVSLVPVLQGRVGADAFAERLIVLNAGGDVGGVYKEYKYLAKGRSTSLFDLSKDRLERKNLADKKTKLVRSLRRRVARELDRQKAAQDERPKSH